MIKKTIFLLFALIISVTVFSQHKESVKITLKSGAIHYGELIVQTDEMVMVQEKDGSKYQFQTSDILKTEIDVNGRTGINPETTSELPARDTETPNNSPIYALAETCVSSLSTQNAFNNTTAGAVRLSIGKQMLSGNIFAGAGMGIITSLEKETQISLLPTFLRFNYLLNKNRLSPFAGMEAGYSFSLNKYYGGGMFVSADLGVSLKYSSRNYAKLSITTGIQQIKTNLTETSSAGTFSYYGNTAIFNFGLKAGMQF